MVFPLVLVYLLFGLGFAAGYCGSREARNNNGLYEIVLWLAAIVAWPLGLGLFTGGWLAKYWPDHPAVETDPMEIEFDPDRRRMLIYRAITRPRGAK